MANKILNWGLLSTANINRALITPLRASKRNVLLAAASRTQPSADKYAREWKIARAYGSYEAMLADPEIDVVYNSLPNRFHAEWTIKAIEAGKHVLCEKPLALSVDEVDAVQSAARKHGRVVAEAFMYRHHPQTLKVQELVKSGSLGNLKLIRGSFSFFLSREGDIRLDPTIGGGSLWDVGCYPLSYARSAIGEEPLEVFGWQVTGPTGIDETFVGQLRFDHDIYAQFDCSFVIPLHWFMEIVGSEGTLNIPSPFKPETDEKIYLTRGNKTETIKIKGQELYIGEVEDMADAILLGHKPRISLEDSRANVAAISALLESAHLGKSIAINH
ncbi:MAG TPA: Gfo/Idh/MocA family oxidoreductase [Anaerolineales bacterium]|nr:Gfo/Idh/MocA family oxidoreductase [Anaerolineales bacterium]HLO29996.1 Gfo/Idh/MocA family oxidoreductase [Anaerolineales bacterium]